MVVVGINTARSLIFKGGRVNRAQVKRTIELFSEASGKRVRVLVTHHPFDLPGEQDESDLVSRAAMAIADWRGCAPDRLLAGTSIGTAPARRPNATISAAATRSSCKPERPRRHGCAARAIRST